MGQPDLSSNRLISHPDVFADIINTIVYDGRLVLNERNLKPFYVNTSTAKPNGKLKGLYRDNCMEDLRNGIRYIIWGIENQYVFDRTTPFKVMGYDYTSYDRQIESFQAQNKKEHAKTYITGLLPEQKLTPVITLILYYGDDNLPDNICAMLNMPEEKEVRKFIQNYNLNVIRLKEFTKEQTDLFRSDFSCIAKCLAKSYNKQEQLNMLKESKQVLLHPRDTLFTLASITKDQRYLSLSETNKEKSKMCEIADALEKMGYDKGIMQGKDLERENGIKSMIEACQELNVAKAITYEKVSQKYNLPPDKATEYMKKYWI